MPNIDSIKEYAGKVKSYEEFYRGMPNAMLRDLLEVVDSAKMLESDQHKANVEDLLVLAFFVGAIKGEKIFKEEGLAQIMKEISYIAYIEKMRREGEVTASGTYDDPKTMFSLV